MEWTMLEKKVGEGILFTLSKTECVSEQKEAFN